MEIHRSALKHGVGEEAIRHAIDRALVVIDLEPDAEPPKVLAIGTDDAGRFLEVIWLEFDDGIVLVIHAMALRKKFYPLLPTPNREDT